MKKQKLFKMFNCINSYTPDLFGINRVVFLDADQEGQKVEEQKTPEAQGEKKQETLTDTQAQGSSAVGKATDKMNIFEATTKVVKSVDYLIKKQKLAIDYDKFLDVLKDKKFLAKDFKQDQLNADVAVAEAIKAMQRDLGFKGAEVDGIIGKNTFTAIGRRPDMLLALVGAQYPQNAVAKKAGEQEPTKEEAKEKPELPADAKSKIEAELSKISDAIQMNYKTIANLHGKLFNADGTFTQPTNATDLMGYKAALDNISGQLKTANEIGGGLGGYKVPDNFMLTITNQSGDTKNPYMIRCFEHGTFSLSKIDLFSDDISTGQMRLAAYRQMQENFGKRLSESKRDYDRIVQEEATKLAGKPGTMGNSADVYKFDTTFGGERIPPVLALLGKKPKDFQSDVIDKTGTILAERNAKEDKEMAEEGVRNAEKLMTDVADRLVRATAVVDKKQMEFDITRTKLTKAREAVSKAEAPTASASENQDIETKRSTLVAAEADFSKATTELKDAQYDIGAIQRDLAQAREKLGQKQQELAALTMPKLPDGVAAADD